MSSTALKKSLTDAYMAFREEFHGERFGTVSDDEVNVPLDREEYDAIELRTSLKSSEHKHRDQEAINLAAAPIWLGLVKPIERKLESIENDLTAFSRKLDQGDSFGLSRKEEQEVLMSRSRQITNAFKAAKMEVTSLNNYTDMKPQEAYMRKNIMSLLVLKLQDQMNRLSKLQFLHQEKLTVKKKATKYAVPIALDIGDQYLINQDVDEDDEDDEMISRYDIGFTQEQQSKIELERIQIEQREQQINEIAEQVEELAVMFNDVAQLIHNQGTLLDRIDYNIDNADHSITKAQSELRSAVKKERGFSKCLCCLLLSVLISGTTVSVLVGKK
ncbi:uncharacterized protein LOC126326544 [Schistocerca gregaria]|uniref:uncharacterized protein LOC126326544 n=1 Tax=Schistocerca gregaria TaxID=7010 RepID=UPI00211F36ED|nr:uncharacterized protein LOC126326544 [Schistocerca gregaria]